MKSLLRKLLTRQLVRSLKRLLERTDKRLLWLFSRSGFLSSLYYLLFSRQFDREHKAVLQGRLRYWQSLKQMGKSSALLRRNTHRLEKGLIMQPRRPVFAEGYIMETVKCFRTAMATEHLCAEEKQWATDVLREYFSVVDETPAVAKAKALFEQVSRELENKSAIPKAQKLYPQPAVTTEQLQQLFTRRRSVRWFLQQPVDNADIRKAVNLASLAPSACNRQPYEFYLVNDAERAPDIAKCAMGTVGFAENIPCIIAVVGNLEAYPAERDRHCIYIDGSLAAMQLMLALETLGLSSCPINWPDIESRERMLSRKLKLDYQQRPIMLIAVGYADPEGGVPHSQKKGDAVLVNDVLLNDVVKAVNKDITPNAH
ncbi:MAG: nitroreductase family protein [Pseudomonadota bacterium]